MKRLGGVLILFCALLAAPSGADVIRMSIDLSEYPEMEAIPGYPVYYAPQLQMNYFFYDGKYWVFQDDNWYESSWYDGPWWLVDPEDVPDYILRVPLQYYLEPPTFFFGWIDVEPPHWGEHWGHEWERHRHGWDKWDHRVHLKAAPLPLYQREYSGDKYPRQIEIQRELRERHYRYQPHDPFVQQRRQQEVIVQGAPVPPGVPPQDRRERRREIPRPAPAPQGEPAQIRTAPSQREVVREQREVRHEPGAQVRRSSEERPQEAGTQEPRRRQEQERGRDQDRRER